MALSAMIEVETVSMTSFTPAKNEGDGRDVESALMICVRDLPPSTRDVQRTVNEF